MDAVGARMDARKRRPAYATLSAWRRESMRQRMIGSAWRGGRLSRFGVVGGMRKLIVLVFLCLASACGGGGSRSHCNAGSAYCRDCGMQSAGVVTWAHVCSPADYPYFCYRDKK